MQELLFFTPGNRELGCTVEDAFILGEKGFERLQKQNITKTWRFNKGTNIFVFPPHPLCVA